MNVALLCSGLLVVLFAALSLNVSRQRFKNRRGVGHSDDGQDPVTIAVRAHGNAAEYIPLFIVLFLFLGYPNSTHWVNALIIGATFARFLQVYGMMGFGGLHKPNSWRRVISAIISTVD